MKRDEAKAFWKNVQIGADDECWPWLAYRDRDGYGRVRFAGKKRGAHRVAYGLAKGPVPAQYQGRPLEIMHSCDNPACCNPDHLSIGNALINQHDKLIKGRTPVGKLSGRYKHGRRINKNALTRLLFLATDKLTG